MKSFSAFGAKYDQSSAFKPVELLNGQLADRRKSSQNLPSWAHGTCRMDKAVQRRNNSVPCFILPWQLLLLEASHCHPKDPKDPKSKQQQQQQQPKKKRERAATYSTCLLGAHRKTALGSTKPMFVVVRNGRLRSVAKSTSFWPIRWVFSSRLNIYFKKQIYIYINISMICISRSKITSTAKGIKLESQVSEQSDLSTSSKTTPLLRGEAPKPSKAHF